MTLDIAKFKHEYPFAAHFIDRDGLSYHYLDEGQGEVVIMLHGNPSWSYMYRRLVKDLRPHHRVIVPDHIGCGLSDKPNDKRYTYTLEHRVADLQALVDTLKLDNITLVMHDWGGMIGMAFALKNRSKIKRLVLMNTAAFLLPAAKKLPKRLKAIRNCSILATPAVRGLNVFARAATVMGTSRGLKRHVKQGLLAPYDSWRNRIATLRFVQDIPLVEGDPSFALAQNVDRQLHQLKNIPMLILWGMGDFIFDESFYNEWCSRFPDAETHVFENCGHYLVEDAPEEVIGKIKPFLQA